MGSIHHCQRRLARWVVAVSPEGNKEIFSADPDTFSASAADSFGRGDSQFRSGHRRRKNTEGSDGSNPSFSRSKDAQLRQPDEDCGKGMDRATGAWESVSDDLHTTQAITLDVIIYAVFGVDHGQRVGTVSH